MELCSVAINFRVKYSHHNPLPKELRSSKQPFRLDFFHLYKTFVLVHIFFAFLHNLSVISLPRTSSTLIYAVYFSVGISFTYRKGP